MLRRLLPRQTSFFDLFEEHAALIVAASRELLSMHQDPQKAATRIKDLERKADSVVHRTIQSLHKIFITPIERDDIHTLIKRLDNVIDQIDQTARYIVLYDIRKLREDFTQLVQTLVEATEAIQRALPFLRDMKNAPDILDICMAVNRLENEGDRIHEGAVAVLFREETSPLDIVKWQRIYDSLENAIDECEDVADILEGILLENA